MSVTKYGIITQQCGTTDCVPKIIKSAELAEYIRESLEDGDTVMEIVPFWDSSSESYFDGLFRKHYTMIPSDDERFKQMYDNWLNETNDIETEEWREELTPDELTMVEAWDDGWDTAMNGMRYGSMKNPG